MLQKPQYLLFTNHVYELGLMLSNGGYPHRIFVDPLRRGIEPLAELAEDMPSRLAGVLP